MAVGEMNNIIRVLGIDPAMRNFGLARCFVDIDRMEIIDVETLDLIQTSDESGKKVRKNSDDLRRARLLVKGLERAALNCAVAVAEMPVGSQSARAMASYGLSIGVLASCPIPLIQVTPAEVKIAACDDKTATKEEMIEWATGRFPHANWRRRKVKGEMKATLDNEHLADAVGAVEAGLRTDQFAQAVALLKSMAA